MPYLSALLSLKVAPVKNTVVLGRFDVLSTNTHFRDQQHFGKCVSLISRWVKRLKRTISGPFVGQAKTWSVGWLPGNLITIVPHIDK